MSSNLAPENVTRIVEAVGSNVLAVADALRQCFDFDQCALEPREPQPLGSAEAGPFEGPGVFVTFDFGFERVAVLIPDALPLPEWVHEPGRSEAARLANLAFEWSVVLLPVDFEATATAAVHVDDLVAEVRRGTPADGATTIDFAVDLGGAELHPPMRMVWPLAVVADAPAASDDSREPEEARPAAGTPAHKPMAEDAPQPAAKEVRPSEPAAVDARGEKVVSLLRRIGGVRVPLAVRLAEKRIDVKQLIEFRPGSLVMFEKNCEAPLELFVNNRPFAVGEAVKVGEKFGLKIDSIGPDAR